MVPNILYAIETDILWQLQYQRSEQDYALDHGNNPNNAVYRFYDSSDRIEARPEISMLSERFRLNLNPRASYTQEDFSGDNQEATDTALRYGSLEYFLDQGWLKLGRYVNWWGPARLLSPSNRYHTDAGQTDPHTELLARDYIEFGGYLGTNWQLGVVWNYAKGEQEINNFARTADLQLTWQSTQFSITGMVSKLDEGQALGGYGQWTLNEATIFYLDILFKTDGQALVDQLDGLDEKSEEYSAVIGGSYTFENGLNIVLDYFKNSEGLSDAESQRIFEQNLVYTGQLLTGQAGVSEITFIQELSDVPFYQLGTDYAILMLQLNNYRDDLDIGYSQIINLVDESTQRSLNIDYRAMDNLTLYLGAFGFSGGEKTEFGRFFDSRYQLGLEIFF